ncbi:unnamed protein product [Anisakis simplex]|uniref:Transmembrane protein n=1 Tax=Anisakis simplex TaxID=6269 RepID=A0A158PMU3_ANISI|nr:unnamed protein product [Anisakis simplex]
MSTSNEDDFFVQLFSFDGLTPGTWFAIRILYRLFFIDNSSRDLATKQEIIVQTKNSSRYDQSIVNERVVLIDSIIVQRTHMHIAVKSVFTNTKKRCKTLSITTSWFQIATVIVPELLCERGTIKPLAQQVNRVAEFDFDMNTVMVKSSSSRSPKSDPSCKRLCIFPFLRVIINNVTEMFKAREWCATIDELKHEVLLISSASTSSFPGLILCLLLNLLSSTVYLNSSMALR